MADLTKLRCRAALRELSLLAAAAISPLTAGQDVSLKDVSRTGFNTTWKEVRRQAK